MLTLSSAETEETMAGTIARELNELWNGVDNSVWTAPRKNLYYKQIYEPICEKASEIEKNIQELENYSQNCVNQCNIV